MDYYGTALELKTVDFEQRIIAGHAAAHSNEDRVRDIIDPPASAWAVKQLGGPGDVAVFIGHQHDALPMGIPLRIEATPQGLYTETLIKPGVFGDDLLQTAKFLQEHGQPLGMSIGYQTVESRPDRIQGKMVRRILKYRLKEFSYAANQTIANPRALVTSVKTLPEDGESGGGVEDANEDKTVVEERTAAGIGAHMDSLPDSSFLFIEGGGQQDSEGKTVPRSKRHFPIKDAAGAIDTAQLRAAVDQIAQANAEGLDEVKRITLQTRVRRMLEDIGSGKTTDPQWGSGAPLAIRALGYALLDLSDQVAEEQKAMALLGEDTKEGMRIRGPVRDALSIVALDLKRQIDWSATIERGEDALATVARYRALVNALDI